MGFYSAPTAKKRSTLSRLWKAIDDSDVFVPSFVVGFLVFSMSTIFWGWTSFLAMAFILHEIKKLKDEIRKK